MGSGLSPSLLPINAGDRRLICSGLCYLVSPLIAPCLKSDCHPFGGSSAIIG